MSKINYVLIVIVIIILSVLIVNGDKNGYENEEEDDNNNDIYEGRRRKNILKMDSNNINNNNNNNGMFNIINLLPMSMLQTGIIFSIWGSVTAGVLTVCYKVLNKIKERYWTIVQVPSTSYIIFQWINYALSEMKELRDDKATRLVLTNKGTVMSDNHNNIPNYYRGDRNNNKQDEEESNDLIWSPTENYSYRITFKGKWIWLTLVSSEQSSQFGVVKNNSFKLECLGANKNLILEFVDECKKSYMDKMREKTLIYAAMNASMYSNTKWRLLGSKPSRPIDTVILPNNMTQQLIDDMTDFVENEEFYYRRGIPYRRGYLLSGPPGTGKTSIITAIAGYKNLPIYMLNLASKQLTDETLLSLFSETPKHSIILLEDIDSIFDHEKNLKEAKLSKDINSNNNNDNDVQNDEKKNDSRSRRLPPGFPGGPKRNIKNEGVSFSSILNILDGVTSSEGKIVVLTTNHVDRLDSALIRPGRIDVSFEFKLATQDSIKRLFLKFYSDEKLSKEQLDDLATNYSEQIPNDSFSMAEIVNHLMFNRTSPIKAIEDIDCLINRKLPIINSTKIRMSNDGLEDPEEIYVYPPENMSSPPRTRKSYTSTLNKRKKRRNDISDTNILLEDPLIINDDNKNEKTD